MRLRACGSSCELTRVDVRMAAWLDSCFANGDAREVEEGGLEGLGGQRESHWCACACMHAARTTVALALTGNMKTSPNRRTIFNQAERMPELLFVNEVRRKVEGRKRVMGILIIVTVY